MGALEPAVSQKRKNCLVPVLMNELVGGQTYIEMTVCMDGEMYLDYFVVKGQPFKDHESKINRGLWKFRTYSRSVRERYATDSGVNPARQYNSNRVFRHTGRNVTALEDLVRRQALREYLELIKQSRIEERIESMRLYAAQPEDYLDDFESFDDEGPDMARDLDGDWVDADSL